MKNKTKAKVKIFGASAAEQFAEYLTIENKEIDHIKINDSSLFHTDFSIKFNCNLATAKDILYTCIKHTYDENSFYYEIKLHGK